MEVEEDKLRCFVRTFVLNGTCSRRVIDQRACFKLENVFLVLQTSIIKNTFSKL